MDKDKITREILRRVAWRISYEANIFGYIKANTAIDYIKQAIVEMASMENQQEEQMK